MPTDTPSALHETEYEFPEKLKLEIYVEMARHEITDQLVWGATVEELGKTWEVGALNIEKILRQSLICGGNG